MTIDIAINGYGRIGPNVPCASLLEDMKTPSSYDYNVKVTRKVVEIAHLSVCRSRANSASWVRSKAAKPGRRTDQAPRASFRTTSS